MNATTAKNSKETWLHISLLVVAVILAYSKIFHAGFIEWDDGEYVVNNKDIRSFAAENISGWFSRFYVGNYQPITMLSYAIDYLIAGVQPLVYHLTSILIHAATAVAICFFVNRLQPVKAIGLFAALLFALHPSQTESVSWIAERKTVLCAMFYFIALYQYTLYVEKPSGKRLAGILLLGVCCMFSKAIGVALPLSMLATDIWLQRDLKNRKVWLEKVPFFAMSLAVGIVAINAQGKFLNMHRVDSTFDTLLYAGYAYVQYIIHFLLPVKLSVYYLYPHETGSMQYICSAVALGIIALAFVAYRRRWYMLCGSIVFYTVNIAPLLQFVQFGENLMADRYLYIAGVGIVIPAAFYLYTALQKFAGRGVAIAVPGCAALFFLGMTYMRNDVWQSDFNFYSAILEAYPNTALPHYSMGALYMKQGDYRQAEEHLDEAIRIDPNSHKAWYNKGMLCMRQKRVREAFDAFTKCIDLRGYTKAYFSRALIYQSLGKPREAVADVQHVIDDQPQNAKAYFLKAECLEELGDAPGAIDNYSRAIAIDDKDPKFFVRRGMIYGKTRQNAPALVDMDRAVSLNPTNGEALYFRGIVKYHAGQDPCADFRQALRYGYREAQDALTRACRQ